jgi:hypothetical protein
MHILCGSTLAGNATLAPEHWGDPIMTGAFVRSSRAAVLLAAVAAACGGSTAAAPQGGLRQSCYPNGTCNAGLTCLSDVCVAAPGDGGSDSDSGWVRLFSRANNSQQDRSLDPPQSRLRLRQGCRDGGVFVA